MAKTGPKPGTPKAKNSGRQKGTPNKKTFELVEIFQQHGYEPAASIIKLLNESKFLTDKDKAMIHLDLMQYKYPRRKAVDHSIDEGQQGEVVFVASWGNQLPDETT